MPGALCPVVTLFLTGFLVGIKIAAAQTITTTAPPPPGPETCPELSDYNKTVELRPEEFIHQLNDCVQNSEAAREKLTANALFPVLVYENLKKNRLVGLYTLFNDQHNATLTKIIECVKKSSGKDFKKEEAKNQFGINGTQYLVFDYEHCSNSMETKDCVEDVYFDNVKDIETKIHKDAFTSSFEILSAYCQFSLRYNARGSGYNVLPSLSLIMGTAVMITKLAIFY